MISFLLSLIFISLLICLHALFMTLEFGGSAARRTLISQKNNADSWMTKLLISMLEDGKKFDDLMVVAQIGTSLSILGLGIYAYTIIVLRPVSILSHLSNLLEPIKMFISLAFVLLLLMIFQSIFGKFIPRTLALYDPERMFRIMAIPLRVILFTFGPLIWLFNRSTQLILGYLGFDLSDEMPHVHSAGEIKELVSESYEGGQIDSKERQMVRNTLRLRDLTARQVMVPRTRLIAAPVDSTVIDLMDKAIEQGLSRLPIYNNNIDHIIGFVHVKDLFSLHLKGETNSSYLLREVIYVPESLSVAQVWDTLNRHRQYLAIVFDEHGGTAGLITFEDLIEEIFGELQDEFDEHETAIISQDHQGLTHLRADFLISDLNDYFKLSLPEENADTLGGLVYTELSRQPRRGDEVVVNQIRLRVEDIEDITITEVSLKLPGQMISQVREWE